MRLRFWLGFAVVAAVAIGSIAVALVVHQRERGSFEERQRSEAARAAHQAEALAALSIGQLGSAAAFYEAEGEFTQHEFDVIADSLLKSGGLAATGFLRAVPSADKESFERRHRLPILERGPVGELRPASRRDLYYPLLYAATASGLSVTLPLGYDVGNDSLRGPYVHEAHREVRVAATPVMRLPAGGIGINVFRPVYRDGAPTGSAPQRRAALTGLAIGSFHVADLAEAATAALPPGVEAALIERGRPIYGERLPREGSAAVPVRIADRNWLLVVRDPARPGVDLAVAIALVGIVLAGMLGALVLLWSRSERMHELTRQANHDPLTGLKNRRRFEEDLRAELARSHRYRASGALLMLDLDHFKQVNDTLGHAAGDRVLADIAAVLRNRARETDVVARLGGDEFAIVLPNCDPEAAREIAGEITAAIKGHVGAEGDIPPITASVGIAPFGTGQRLSYESVVARADAAMYAAKSSGRNRVRVSDPATANRTGEATITVVERR